MIRKLICLTSLGLLSQVALQAESCCCFPIPQEVVQEAHFGNAGFGVTDPNLWYTITTNSYPDAVLLSKERNKGLAEGGVYLSPTGFTIGERGNYNITITAILQNISEESILVPVFLAQNDEFDTVSPGVGGVVVLAPGNISSLHGTGIVTDIEPGTRLSLVATNGGSAFPQNVTVVGWGISLFKLPGGQ